MNRERRKEIEAIKTRLADIKSDLEMLQDEEQQYYDVMPEGIQMSEKGDRAEEVIGFFDEAVQAFDEIEYALDQAGE
jgi:hypothetical protein